MAENDEILRGILVDKCHELFAAYNVPCVEAADARSEPPPDEPRLCAVLGFTSDQLRGSVVLSASAAAIADSNPIRDGATRGWIAELSNQLVGRFKNGLLRRGLEITMSVPVVLEAVRLTAVPSSELSPIQLAVGAGELVVWLEIDCDPGVVIASSGEQVEVAAEGDAMMFF